jgi:hypothetical protein
MIRHPLFGLLDGFAPSVAGCGRHMWIVAYPAMDVLSTLIAHPIPRRRGSDGPDCSIYCCISLLLRSRLPSWVACWHQPGAPCRHEGAADATSTERQKERIPGAVHVHGDGMIDAIRRRGALYWLKRNFVVAIIAIIFGAITGYWWLVVFEILNLIVASTIYLVGYFRRQASMMSERQKIISKYEIEPERYFVHSRPRPMTDPPDHKPKPGDSK